MQLQAMTVGLLRRALAVYAEVAWAGGAMPDRKSTRLNSSHRL